MRRMTQTLGARLAGDRGFAMLVAIFALLIMSTVAVAALITSDDERRSARAVRSASASFYAAEAGLHEVWATKLDSAFVDSLEKGKIIAPGGSLDLGWKTLNNGARYNVRLVRYDNGGQKVYGLVAEGRGAGGVSGQQVVSFRITAFSTNGTRTLGRCCDAAATIRGAENIQGTTLLTGMDGAPSSWTAAGRCTGIPTQNTAGITMADTTKLTKGASVTLDGAPKKAQDPTLNGSDFLNYGDLSFADLKAMANHTFAGSTSLNLAATTNFDGTCKTTDPYNWGSSNPAHPCYNYFPIIVVKGTVQIKSGYGQALVLLDRVGGVGGMFEVNGPAGTMLTGIIMGFGCPEVENVSQFYGAVFVDKLAQGACNPGQGLLAESGQVRWSSCVVQRLLEARALGSVPVVGVQKLTRGFETTLR